MRRGRLAVGAAFMCGALASPAHALTLEPDGVLLDANDRGAQVTTGSDTFGGVSVASYRIQDSGLETPSGADTGQCAIKPTYIACKAAGLQAIHIKVAPGTSGDEATEDISAAGLTGVRLIVSCPDPAAEQRIRIMGTDHVLGDEIETCAGHDDIGGGDGPDVIDAAGGSDRVEGGLGNDSFAAADHVYDLLSYAEYDRPAGLEGAVLDPGGGTVTPVPGETDTVGPGYGYFFLSQRGDTAYLAAPAVVYGLDGEDELYGSDGADELLGGNEDDTMHPGLGDDEVDGGEGRDAVVYDTGTRSSGVSATLPSGGSTTVLGENGESDEVASVDALFGSEHADTLHTYKDGAEIGGLGGDDLIGVAHPAWQLEPGIKLTGGAGQDTLEGSAGDDVMSGGDDGDTLRGNSGGDRMYGGAGTDDLQGGDGDDELRGGHGADDLLAGEGVDTIGYDDHDSPVTVTVGAGSDDDGSLEDGDPGARDDVQDGERFVLGHAADELTGTDLAETVEGGKGDDVLRGAGGDDELVGDDGQDTAAYDDRTDAVTASLAAGAGGVDGETDAYETVERLLGGTGDDELTGDQAPNALAGGEGDDTLTGLGGADALRCGAGADTVFRDAFDTVSDCEVVFGDADGDGIYVGEDCDDGDPGVAPGLHDVPGNGIDEDCSGADAAVDPVPDPIGPGPADTTAPVLSAVTVSPRRFSASTTFALTVSEAATLRIRIARLVPGRRKGARCTKGTARTERRRCTRAIPAHAYETLAVAGENRIALSRRLPPGAGGRSLRRGRYRVTLTGTDAAGNRSNAVRGRFRIVRR